MSMHLYGGSRLTGFKPEWQAEVKQYWQGLAELHHVHLHHGYPAQEYLVGDLRLLWDDPSWVRFSLGPILNDRGNTDDFLLRANQTGCRILRELPHLGIKVIWTRVPEWRFLYFMFWHERLTEGCLVIEHLSGDAADLQEAKHVPLAEAIEQLWTNYCLDMSSEAPAVYRFDLSRLPT